MTAAWAVVVVTNVRTQVAVIATLVSRGFGFVEVETAEAANRAVKKLNGVQLDGRAPRMEIFKASAPRSGGGYRPRNASGTSRGRW